MQNCFSAPSAIAVTGIACRYPGAANPGEFWENIISRRRQFRQIPDCRLPIKEYHHHDKNYPDTTYGDRAAVIDGFEFDWAKRRIPISTFKTTDIVHWLALETCLEAVKDAGYTRKNIPGERCGVIIGNTLTGEQTRSATLRLRWPFVKKALFSAARQNGVKDANTERIATVMEQQFKSVFAKVDEDTLAGSLSNTIAGRICNYLNLKGGGYTIDGACSSSLLASATAMFQLACGELDMAIAGGVDISLDPFELVGFSKAGALTNGDMMVYDRRGKGFIPGEGCGFITMKRLEDAQRDSDYIYAVIRGWGISSDGAGAGITAPNANGQALAIQRAYEKAPFTIKDLDFIEGHGTGTLVGDKTELEGISLAMTKSPMAPGTLRRCGITSLKSIIGHTKAASGIGGLIKTILALNRRVVPPTAACSEPHPAFGTSARRIYPVLSGMKYPSDQVMYAGVSSMGFGGINCHITAESWDAPKPSLTPSIDEQALMVSAQDSELFLVTGKDRRSLLKKITNLMDAAKGISIAELTDLAYRCTREIETDKGLKAALVAGEPESLIKNLSLLKDRLLDKNGSGHMVPAGNSIHPDIWFGRGGKNPRIGFLFPGQGSQQLNMGRILNERFSWAKDLVLEIRKHHKKNGAGSIDEIIYKSVERARDPKAINRWMENLSSTENAQPAICLTSLLWIKFLDKLGIKPVISGGHSLGELTAFYAAGALDENQLLRLSALRGRIMADSANGNGAMASLKCAVDDAAKIAAKVDGYITTANINSPLQTVLSGDTEAVASAVAAAMEEGIAAMVLPVKGAFHSSLMKKAAVKIGALDLPESIATTNGCRLFSSTDGEEIVDPVSPAEHFARQTTTGVNFIQMIKNMKDHCDILLEVGPGRILSGLVDTITNGHKTLCLPVESKPSNTRDLNRLLAALFVAGTEINWDSLYKNRLVRPFVHPSQKIYIENPCSNKMEASSTQSHAIDTSTPFMAPSILSTVKGLSGKSLSRYLEKRGPFIEKVIQADLQHWPHEKDSGVPVSEIAPLVRKETPTSVAAEDFQSILYRMIEDVTGFAPNSLSPELRLLDDLNLDSIKAGDLVANFADICGVRFPDDPSMAANATLQQLIDMVHTLKSSNKSKSKVSGRSDIEKSILGITAKITGFPMDSLNLRMKLVDDLNLDSIKIGDILSLLQAEIGTTGEVAMEAFSNATLEAIVDHFEHEAKSIPISGRKPEMMNPLKALMEQACQLTGYTAESLDPDAIVETDLFIGPDKLKTLLSRTVAMLGVEIHLDIEQLQFQSLRRIADILKRMAGDKLQAIPPKPDHKNLVLNITGTPWVRRFTMTPVECPFSSLPESFNQRSEDNWQLINALVIHAPESQDVAEALADDLILRGARATRRQCDHQDIKDTIQNAEFSHIFSILPKISKPGETDLSRMNAIIDQNTVVCTLPDAAYAPRRRTTLSFIQFGGGFFGRHPRYANVQQCCTLALAESIHLERRDLRVRTIDFSPLLSPDIIAETTIAESITPESFTAAGYDHNQKRRILEPALSHPEKDTLRKIPWSSEDLILSTGGAKGITASCTLAVAMKTGVRTALVGSSPHPDVIPGNKKENEIAKTLQKYKDHGLEAQYLSCDITDTDAVKQLINDIEEKMGPVTAVIHGAGLNMPSPAKTVSASKARKEISPKVLGAMNLLSLLEEKPPKIIIGMGSIIGLSGMPGNAWYGFSNEALDILLRHFGADHPETDTLTIAYGIWRDEGMGARLGSVKRLKQQGIDAIPTEQGVKGFVRLFTHDPGNRQVVVTSRLSGLDTWKQPASPEIADARYLENLVHHTHGVESVFSTHLSLEEDPYLKEHQFQGSFLFPTVFGLEAMAQAVAHVSGISSFSRVQIKSIHLRRPITVDPDKGADIMIRAVKEEALDKRGKTIVNASIIKLGAGATDYFFKASFILGLTDHGPEKRDILQTDAPLPIIPELDLYRDTLLFQGKAFQRIEKIYSIRMVNGTKGGAVFTSRITPSDKTAKTVFPKTPGARLFLGDPFFRDSLLQSSAILTPKDTSLPVRIQRMDIYPLTGEMIDQGWVAVSMTGKKQKEITNRVCAVSPDGRVIESLEGYQLKIIKRHNDYPGISDLKAPGKRDLDMIRAAISQSCANFKVNAPELFIKYLPGIHKLKKAARRTALIPWIKKSAARIVQKTNIPSSSLKIKWSDKGKPYVDGIDVSVADISLSHDDRLCLCVAGKGPLGCDVAPVTPRSRKQWDQLLGKTPSTLLDGLLDTGDRLDPAGTRIWSAIEASIKASSGEKRSLEIAQRQGEAVLFRSASDSREPAFILTVPVHPTWGPEKIIAVTVAPTEQPMVEKDPQLSDYPGYEPLYDTRSFEMREGGPQGQLMFVQRFPITFQPSAQLSRTIYFSNFIKWMGNTREASAWPVLSTMSKQFASGKWGGVTNFGNLKILGEGGTSDQIEVRMWVSDNSGPENSTMTLTYDFRKMVENGYERLALCTLQTTWVEILGPGEAKAAPYPPYYDRFIDDMCPQFDAPNDPEPLPESLSHLYEEGKRIYRAPDGPSVNPVLKEQTFETTLAQANLVGNIYYANYYEWQGQIRDRYFYDLIPQYYKGTGENGELLCLESRVNHLREAMPFDRILLVMALKEHYENSVRLHMDYYRVDPDGSRVKIAYGHHHAVWVKRDKKGKPITTPFPKKIQTAFKMAVSKQG